MGEGSRVLSPAMLQAQSMKGRYDVLGGSTRSSSFRGQPTGNASVLHGQGEGKRGGRRRQEQQRGRVGVRGFGLGGGSRALRRVTKMPVAVPRVPYRTPQENWQWVDLWNCLYRERIIFVGQGISEELANQLVGTLLYLDSVSQKDLQMYINTCQGGELVPSLALYDTMKHLKSDVVTVGFGGVMGMAAFLMCAGTKGKRLALSHTRIMMHLPACAARGSSTDMWNETRELLRIRGYMLKCLEQQTGKSQEQLLEDFSRNKYFTPEAAEEYGIIDQVLRPRRKAGK